MWERLFVAMLLHSRPLLFQALKRCAQPASDRLFDLVLVAGTIHGIQRLAGCVQGDVAAGDSLVALLRRHQLHHNPTTPRPPPFLATLIPPPTTIRANNLHPPNC